EYFRFPQYNVSSGAVIPLPPELSCEEGAMIEPAACCIRAIRRANVEQGDNTLVVGRAPTGLTQIQVLRHATTSKIIGSDIVEAEMEEAIRLVSETRLDSKSLISDRVKFGDAKKAMEFAKTSKTAIKTIIVP